MTKGNNNREAKESPWGQTWGQTVFHLYSLCFREQIWPKKVDSVSVHLMSAFTNKLPVFKRVQMAGL